MMDTKRFNEEHAAKSRAVCERIEREDAERRGKLSERERQILDMWPRFEDGGYVWFGDVVKLPTCGAISIEAIEFTAGKVQVKDAEDGDWNTSMCAIHPLKRPAPKVLDADGVERKISEMVWSGLYDAMTELRNNCEIAAKPTATTDTVSHPAHYTQGGIECIDAMESALTPEEFSGYLRANVIKYIWRYDRKGAPVEDLRKATWYLDKLIGEVERDA